METKFLTFTIRVNGALKAAFSDFCKKKGLSSSFAVKRFVRQFAESGSVPFSLCDMAGDRDGGSVNMKIYMDAETRTVFAEACAAIGETVTMSHVIRGFMDYCVTNNRFPEMK